MHLSALQVDQWIIRPDINRIENALGSQNVGPRVMQLLLKLLDTPGEVHSREELLTTVWDDVIVNEESLTKSISFLRQHFKDGNNHYIETIRSVGYRWIGPRPMIIEGPSTPLPVYQKSKNVTFNLKSKLATAVFSVLAITLILFTSITSKETAAPQLISITNDKIEERVPRLSPDGSSVLFAKNTPNSGMDVYVRNIKTEETTRLTTSNTLETDPVWSPDGKKIAFYRNNFEDVSIEEKDLITGEQRKLVNVNRIPNLSAISWSPDGETLAFCDQDMNTGQWSLYELEAETLTTERLTFPAKGIHGDLSPRYSPDGKKLAFIRIRGQGLLYKHLIPGVGDVFAIDLQNKKETCVYEGSMEISGVDWLNDSERLGIIAVKDYYNFEIISLDIENGQHHDIYSTQKLLRNLSITYNQKGLVFEEWTERYAIWKADLNDDSSLSNYRPYLDVAEKSWHPQISHSGESLVYISTKSGRNQIWLRHLKEKTDEQLTELDHGIIRNPRWSKDDSKILFETLNNKNFDIYFLDLQNKKIEEILTTPRQERNAVWSEDGESIYFALKETDVFNIYKKKLADGEELMVTTSGGFAVKLGLHGLYYLSHLDEGIFHIDEGGNHTKIIDEINPVDWFNWEVVGDHIYFVKRLEGFRPHLYRFDLLTHVETDISGNRLNFSHVYQGISIDPNAGVIYATVNDYSRSDIKMLVGM